ncbi:MAG: nitroreductase family protein [Lachnospiraceae bacterium]|nr:nitroreductase family protein [Lachnospiraceae bacterium]MDD3796036.1 nitroreductase family protein [Lachnospiraceae bacterium]
MNLYEAVYGRRSIRKFRMEPMSQAVLSGIFTFMEQMEPLFPGIEIKLEIVDNITKKNQMKGLFLVEAPYYLLIYSEKKEKCDLNAGFIMEQISLYLFTKGVGSCFQGFARKKTEEEEDDGMTFIIAMAFGRPKGPLLRQEYEAKRMPVDSLCMYKEKPKTWVKEILEASRLAPSSMNNQPWRFVVYENRVHVFSKKPTSKRALWNRFTEFDMGVMLANIMVAAEEIWVHLDLIRLDNITHKNLPNNQYLLSVLMKE